MGDSVLEAVDSFCYLGDTLSAAGGCDTAAIARCKSAWGKFHELLPVLTERHLPFKVKGRLYSSIVRNSMLHAVETWPMSSKVLQRMRRNDRAMIRWMCRVKSTDESLDELHAKLGLRDIEVQIRERRLRWFGHVKRSSKEINKVRTRKVSGKRGPAHAKKTWALCVKDDLKVCRLNEELTQDREAWRSSVRNCLLEPTLNRSAPLSTAKTPAWPVLRMRTRSSINNKTGFD